MSNPILVSFDLNDDAERYFLSAYIALKMLRTAKKVNEVIKLLYSGIKLIEIEIRDDGTWLVINENNQTSFCEMKLSKAEEDIFLHISGEVKNG